MRVFYDANAILSILLWPGVMLHVHERLVETGADVVTSERVVAEVLDVAARKLPGVDAAALRHLDREIRRAWRIVPVSEARASYRVRDPDDERVLADAEAAGADVLMTGDRDLTDEASQIKSLAVRSPRQVLDGLG